MTTLVAGVVLLSLSVVAFCIALPRNGEVRGFLRNDHVQAYFTVTMIALLTFGAINLVNGILDLRG